MSGINEKAERFDWQGHRQFLQRSRFRPLFDRAFSRVFREEMQDCFAPSDDIKAEFLQCMDQWIHSSTLNKISGLHTFPFRDFITGVTHSLDDLHVAFAGKLVAIEKEYAYHRRLNPDFTFRTLNTLQAGDVLVFAIPFAWYGAEHPQTKAILDRCQELSIPVHVDAAYYGCLREFVFNFDHPAITSVSFSLSKGMGMGSQRVGIRYSKERHHGPVSIINDFSMEITSLMNAAVRMVEEFGSDYLQLRYGEAYQLVCEKLNLKPTKTIHVAFAEDADGEWLPVGIRPFLRYLVDDHNEFR